MATKKQVMKTSGDGLPAGDWTQLGDGTDYPAETRTYEALRPVNHNHRVYPIGSVELELTDEQAEPLLMHQHIRLATVEVPLDEVA